MGKFCKTGKVVIVLNGRFAGKKGIILRTNYEGSKERPYAHCLVVGLARSPRRPTKRNLAKAEQRIKELEAKENSSEKVAALRRMGVFVKYFNMSHLLFTRYNLKEDFGGQKMIEKVDSAEKNYRESLGKVENKEKKKENDKAGMEKLRAKVGEDEKNYKEEVRNFKSKIGSEMYKRYMKGFVLGNNAESNERQKHTQFLFKKLKF